MQPTFRALLVEDSEDDAVLATRALQRGASKFVVTRVDTEAAMRDAFGRSDWDIVLCDHTLPGFSVEGALAILAERNGDPPLIVVSGTVGEEKAAELIRRGAVDVVLKANIATRLLPAVTREIAAAATRRRARDTAAALAARDQQLKIIAERVPGLVFQRVLRPDGTVAYPFITGSYLGESETRAIELSTSRDRLLDLIHPDDRAAFAEALRRSSVDLSLLAVDVRLPLAGGGIRWLHGHSRPRREPDGSIIWDVVAVDTTDRRVAEDRFRQAVEAAPSAMIMVRSSGAIVMANAQAEYVFGYPRDELLGKQVEELVAEGFRGHHPGLRSAFFQSPETRPMGAGRDLLALHKDGTEFPIEINLNPIETEEGLMVLSAIVDISDRKQKEQRIQDALREKDLMLAEIHHRVKNNLQVIDSLLGLQSAQIHDPIALGALRDSQHRVRSMALIHETLYQSNTFAKIDFAQLLNTLVPALMSSYEVEHGRITLSISATPIALPLNSAIPCGLIVNELTSNALKHAFPNGQHGEIELTLRFNEAGCVALSFADNGVGIPADVDLDNTTGLGLQLIRSLVRQMHGTLQIERANPTRFLVSFPNSVSVRPEGMRVI